MNADFSAGWIMGIVLGLIFMFLVAYVNRRKELKAKLEAPTEPEPQEPELTPTQCSILFDSDGSTCLSYLNREPNEPISLAMIQAMRYTTMLAHQDLVEAVDRRVFEIRRSKHSTVH